MHAYSTNDSLSSDTKFSDLVTLTLTLRVKVAASDFDAAGDILFHKYILLFLIGIWKQEIKNRCIFLSTVTIKEPEVEVKQTPVLRESNHSNEGQLDEEQIRLNIEKMKMKALGGKKAKNGR